MEMRRAVSLFPGQSTGSNEIIDEIISNASPEVMDDLRTLMQGNRLLLMFIPGR